MANWCAMPRMLSWPAIWQVDSWLLAFTGQVSESAENRRSGSCPSPVVKMYLRMCSSRTFMPVARVFTGRDTSMPSSVSPCSSRVIVRCPVKELDFPFTSTPGTLVADSNEAAPESISNIPETSVPAAAMNDGTSRAKIKFDNKRRLDKAVIRSFRVFVFAGEPRMPLETARNARTVRPPG